MSGTLLVVIILAIVALAGLFLAVTARGSDRGAATGLLSREAMKRDRARRKAEAGVSAPPPATGRMLERSTALEQSGKGQVATIEAPSAPVALRAPMDLEQLGATRRSFLNRSIIIMFITGLGSFGGAVLAFLWPSLSGGFGSKVKLGNVNDILAEIDSTKSPKYFPEARTYISAYPKEGLPKASSVYTGGVLRGMESGVVAIYQKCVHLGCKVPWCGNSQWFECACHGSQYNRVGERKGGPAPRGLDRFGVDVDAGGNVVVDTSLVVIGPADGTNTTGQEAEGPHCVGGGH
jgi:cytochrome b6-f complex iron-sulfur subunit